MKRTLQIGLMLMALAVLLVMPVSAHGGREVGDYTVTFGWQVEPAYAGVFNGPEIIITLNSGHGDEADHADEGEHSDEHSDEEMTEEGHHDEGFPADIEVNLTAEVSFGPETTTVVFRQKWQTPGHYVAALTPTLPGDYVFHVRGTIGDQEVDLVFDSADGEFSPIAPGQDILFPAAGSFEARIAALEARIATLEAALAALSE
jgi:hypothetical protein